MVRIFIGLDPRQPIAANVAGFSIERRASKPVSITKLFLEQMPITRMGLTTFTFSRYCVPYLCGYEGKALFLDADMLCRADIYSLPDMDEAVSVVVNKDQALAYERPSVMLFNCAKCKSLTPQYIETGNPQSLEWAESVGKLPAEWNHLVGYDQPDPNTKLAHFTQGIPCFPETKDSEFADEWAYEAKLMMGTVSWAEIMGNSVHAEHVKRRLALQQVRG